MPIATVRANARSMPKPKPGSVASIRRQTADLKSSVALLKAAEVVERELAEPKAVSKATNGQPATASDLEEDIHDVRVWTSLASDLVNDLRIPKEMSAADRLTISQLTHVIDQATDAARALDDRYHGRARQ